MRPSRILRALSLIASCALLSLTVEAAVTLSNLFADNMMFQRGMPVRVFGTANAGESVTVSIGGNTQTVTANASGKWIATLPELAVGTNYTLTVNNLTFTDVAVGDVWFCSGQSNIQIVLNSDADATAEIAAANYPNIRLLRIDTRFPAPNRLLPTLVKWSKCTSATAKSFSAVSYYFGRDLHLDQNVPIGLIDVARGGTKVEAWTDVSTFNSHPVGRAMVEYYNGLASSHPEKQAQDAPGALYPDFVEPFLPFSVKGVLWYQGEHNTGRHVIYHYGLTNLISNWRSAFQQPNLPFVVVQLPNYGDTATTLKNSNIANIRGIQAAVADSVPNVEYTVNIDLGDGDGNIHPERKQPVGKRAALAALKSVYGKTGVWTGPRFKSATFGASDVVISFDELGGGLENLSSPPAFLISNNRANGFVRATASVSGNTVRLTGLTNPIAARYAWEDMPRVTLDNTNGFPVAPFRTDKWHPDNLAPATWASISTKDARNNEDNDNYPNYVEFFANTDWKGVTNDPIIWSVTSPFANTSAFRYRRRDNLWPSITYKIQTSPTNSNTWTDLTYVDYPEVAPTGVATRYWVDYERYEIHVPGSVKARLSISFSDANYVTSGGTTNQSPTASISSPTAGASFTTGTAVTVNASASDDGSVAHVELYVNGTKYGSNDTASPYSWSVTDLAVGSHSLYVIAEDNTGLRTTSSTISISVADAVAGPVITTQPVSKTVTVGGNTSLSVVASGSNLTYTWRQDEAAITASNVTGINSATLTITGATAANAGIYSVVVSDGVNPNVVSNDVTVTVNAVGTDPIVIDNKDTRFSYSSGWWELSLGGSNAGTIHTFNNNASANATLTPGLTGTYTIEVFQPTWTRASTSVPVTVNHSGGSTAFQLNQKANPGAWVKLGTANLTLTATSTIVFNGGVAQDTTTTNEERAMVDAVRLTPVSTPDPEPEPETGPYFEAESYDNVGSGDSPWTTVTDSTASGGKYMVVPEGTVATKTGGAPATGYLDYSFNLAAAGPVYVYITTRETTASNNNSDSLYIDILNDGINAHEWGTGFTTRDSWVRWEWTTNKPTTLPAGDHTLRISYREDGFQLDGVTISATPVP